MADSGNFLARWARLKREAATATTAAGQAPDAQPQADAQAAEPLPPLESLDFGSDFSGFLRAKVEESVKRAALKKLFKSPHFNEMDGLDVYIDDYNLSEPVPEAMLASLAHAKDMLFGDPGGRAEDNPEVPPAADAPEVAAAAEQGGANQAAPVEDGERYRAT
jgi:hypothetical protein